MSNRVRIIVSVLLSLFTACVIIFCVDKLVIGYNPYARYSVLVMGLIFMALQLLLISRVLQPAVQKLLVLILVLAIVTSIVYLRSRRLPSNATPARHYMLR